ncbi:DUF1697 domain-containing protein [Dyadobacter frigoris]|uniref:DUF1697 domain-containing protein n=1 Tax=Dyadobacter frigoris TaxID=2576211 RepID=A0A4U6DAY5_9BACT|nr:DUF1697 domain-containing protein [Dyadobacter frigoris]TKT91464.1 DUF1697 domain-containing protein [Dyadobacter frigoris]GLU51980.1 hypothetical protein Dfri01_14410 [Dyadobacter frigoris]
MKTYVTILRGINVSGQKMIKMAELKKMFETLPFENVRTYIQSGNIVFNAKPENDKDLAKEIHDNIQKTFSFSVPVIVLEEKELKKVQQHNPFLTGRNEDVTKLHVTFLDEIPENTLVEKLKETAQFLPDEWIADGKTIYLFCPNGYGKTKLNNNFFENKLKVTATTRNWKTVNELVLMTSK